MQRHSLFLCVSPRRAYIEAFIICAISWLLLLMLQYHAIYYTHIGTSLGSGMIAMFVAAIRLRSPQNKGRRWLLREGLCLGLPGMLLGIVTQIVAILLFARIPGSPFSSTPDGIFLIGAAICLNIATGIITRSIILLLAFWNRLRRRQLFWTMTHDMIMVVAFGAGLFIVLIEVAIILSAHNRPNFMLIIPATLGLITLSFFGLVVIVPPFAIFSYFVVRRTTQRIKVLAMATNMFRAGNYSIRVPVEGEDEVAQLQTNFNAMANDLEHAMHALQSERDTVAGLLQARRELIVAVSHELRTPVATLRGYLETTLTHWNDSDQLAPSTLHHDMQIMESEVIRLQSLIEDLFVFSRAEVGKLTLRCVPTDISCLIQRIVEVNAPLAWRSSKIEIVADIAPALPQVRADEQRLQQVLQNLLHNALRHTPPGGIIVLTAGVVGQSIQIQVKDTGEGIAPKDLPHIWERFYRAQHAQHASHAEIPAREGSGLGLALVREWIEHMGGTVAVTSVLNEGSCFTLCLPRA